MDPASIHRGLVTHKWRNITVRDPKLCLPVTVGTHSACCGHACGDVCGGSVSKSCDTDGVACRERRGSAAAGRAGEPVSLGAPTPDLSGEVTAARSNPVSGAIGGSHGRDSEEGRHRRQGQAFPRAAPPAGFEHTRGPRFGGLRPGGSRGRSAPARSRFPAPERVCRRRAETEQVTWHLSGARGAASP